MEKEQRKVIGWICEAFQTARDADNITSEVHSTLLRCLRFQWSARMTRTIGLAETDVGVAKVKLSSVLWPVCSEEDKRETVMHEAAHLMVTVTYGASAPPHGTEWTDAMKVLGYENPSPYHTVMSASAEKAKGNKPVHCRCPNSPHTWVTPERKKKMQRKRTTVCRKCGTTVRFSPYGKGCR